MFSATHINNWVSTGLPFITIPRKRNESIKLCNCKANLSVLSSKIATLSAAKRERIKLPTSDNGYRISEFLSHPFGIQAMLNVKTLDNYELIDANTYRCFLPKIQLLNFEAAPVLDLKVTPSEQDCIVEMISCKFQGSEIMERQNEYFSAFMMNRLTWNITDSEPFLEADMKLNVTLEIYTRPFTLLPISAVERPGNFNYCKIITNGKINESEKHSTYHFMCYDVAVSSRTVEWRSGRSAYKLFSESSLERSASRNK